MQDVIAKLVERVLTTERASVEAACMRVLVAIGVDAMRERAELVAVHPPLVMVTSIGYAPTDRAFPEPGPTRRYTLRVDGRDVWTGEWVRSATQGDRWATRWLVDPERLGVAP